MKTTLTQSDFINMWPESRKDSFSYEGKRALFDYLIRYEEDAGTELEFDPIALDCDFTEYADLKEIKETYSLTDIKTIEDLQDHTQVIEFDGGIIIQNF